MKDKKKLIIAIIAIIVITLIFILVFTVNRDRKENKQKMDSIRKNYGLLTVSIANYNEIRNKYSELSSVLIMDSFKDKHDEISHLLDEYNKEMKNIDSYIDNISFRCTNVYNDNEIDKICKNYKLMYEKLVNLYVSDIDNYNNFIVEYNKNKNESLEMIDKVHEDYIDYDNDGNIYGGADNDKSES